MIRTIKNAYHLFLAWLGALIYGNPSRELCVIGITGTKGKTTSVELLRAVLQRAGKKTAMISSAHLAYGERLEVSPSSNTMPGRFFIQRFLRQAVQEGCTHAMFEVTSQGVVQSRHRFIDFDVAALTCLHPEHIESHGGFAAYRGAKVRFFRDVAHYSAKKEKKFFINSATASGGDAQFFENAVAHPTGAGHFGEVRYYSKENFVRNALHGNTDRVSGWLQSPFNLENAALVYDIARSLGVSHESIIETFFLFQGVAGRMEFVRGVGRVAVIDYALTPDSLRSLYQHLREMLKAQPGGRLIGVFGSAGGGRDTWKRPELGRIAGEFCDVVYLTSDDSYDEKPEKIIADIERGMAVKKSCKVVVDRTEAIRAALIEATPADIIAITGMGSQTRTYGPGGRSTPWSDRGTVERLLSTLTS
jgi:UDP-N-acetylmuramoyl-L-alanyl-D-glutamate--2,6-diaminopimelate ligase